MDSIILANDVNLDKFEISSLKTLQNGGKMAFLNYNSGRLTTQLPRKMRLPFGISEYTSEETGNTKYWINVTLDKREKVLNFKKLIEDVDNYVIDHAFKNSKQWFKGTQYKTREILEALYTSNIKYSKDKETGEINDKYDPTLKINIPQRDGEFNISIFDKNANEISRNDIDNLKNLFKGSEASVIMECGGIWVAGSKFGVTWKVVQLQVFPKESINGFAFLKTDDDNDNDIDNIKEISNDLNSLNVSKNEVEESDSDDDDENDSDDDDEKK